MVLDKLHYVVFLAIFRNSEAHSAEIKSVKQVRLPGLVTALFDLNSFFNFNVILISDEFWSSSFCSELFTTNFTTCYVIRYNGSRSANTISSLATSKSAPSAVFAHFIFQENTESFLEELELLYTDDLLRKQIWLPYIFIIINSSFYEPTLVSKTRYGIAADIYLASLRISEDQKLQNVSLFDMYSLKGVDLSRHIDMAVFSSGKIDICNILAKARRRQDFGGVRITGINVDNPLYNYSVTYKKGKNLAPEFESGFVVNEFRYLRDALNFTEGAAKWSTYLRQAPNGSLTGLAVPINYGLADIGIGSNEFLEYRFVAPNGITYLHPTFHNQLQIFFKQPASSSIRDIYLVAFTTKVWALIGGTLVLISGSLMLSTTTLGRIRGNSAGENDLRVCDEAWIWVVGAMCQKGWHQTPSSNSARIIFFIGLVTGLLLYTAYCASLVSILSVDVVPVRKFEDLLTYGFGLYSDDHIPTTALVIKYFQNRSFIKSPPDEDRGLDISKNITRLIETHTAVVSITDSFYQAIRRQFDERFTCATFSAVSFSRRAILSSMFVKRGSPLREYFNYKIITMRERGVMFRLRSHYIEDTSVKCLNTDGEFDRQLSPKDLITAFAVLGSGLAISSVILLVERLLWRFMSNRFRNWQPSVVAKMVYEQHHCIDTG